MKLVRALVFAAILIPFAASAQNRWSVSASTVEKLHGDLRSVTPAVVTPPKPEQYLDPKSCLGYDGPLGTNGPLGPWGPIGFNTWNPSKVMSSMGNWERFSYLQTLLGGPLSAVGSLGPAGPLSETAYNEVLPKIDDFAKQLQGGGVWTVLGPLGALGPLGPMGSLGPMGAHGFGRDFFGNYWGFTGIVRRVPVAYGDEMREHELVELYLKDRAKLMRDNDTSFMVETGARARTDRDDYPFRSFFDQFVTITVVSDDPRDKFVIDLLDAYGVAIASSNSDNYVNWIQIAAKPGEAFKARITQTDAGAYSLNSYRLIVTGSGSARINRTDIHGAHQTPQGDTPIGLLDVAQK